LRTPLAKLAGKMDQPEKRISLKNESAKKWITQKNGLPRKNGLARKWICQKNGLTRKIDLPEK
jgi:hypothetical protein